MTSILPRNPFVRFFSLFVPVYFVLSALTWIGFGDFYCELFRNVGSTVYTDNDERELNFQSLRNDSGNPYYTRIEIANRALLNADDSGPVWHLDFDTIGYGWKPTALLVALIVATPISGKRRAWALAWGLLWEHLFLITFLGYLIWYDSSEVSLVTFTPFWKHIAGGFRDTLVGQFGLTIPVAIWVLVTFRRADGVFQVQRSPVLA